MGIKFKNQNRIKEVRTFSLNHIGKILSVKRLPTRTHKKVRQGYDHLNDIYPYRMGFHLTFSPLTFLVNRGSV